MEACIASESPGFLALVQDAKTRIHEIDIEEYKRCGTPGKRASWWMFAKTRVAGGACSRSHPSEQGHHRAGYRDNYPG